ncbi:MAG: hypothetical protein H7Z41_12865, partial [Cytophagales bacterium]|nr:hypothetical protein [Armatimonadota bacterium]
ARTGMGLTLGFALPIAAVWGQTANPHAGHQQTNLPAVSAREGMPGRLPRLPPNVPSWLTNTKSNEVFYKRGPYNFDVYNIQPLARDLNAVSVGHSMAYEELVRGNQSKLETDTFGKIDRVLKNPPRLMPAERFISPTFSRKYGVLEQIFDWTHFLHAQTVDILASTQLTPSQKEAEIERVYQYYRTSLPYAITPLPMNMGYLYGQPYSKRFRDGYAKTNGLFWGYHWLQGTMYDALYGKTLEEQKKTYEVLGKRYHEVELYKTDRPFMPMTAETSPRFSMRYPHLANLFDNLHMLHDMVNDILVSGDLTPGQKEEQIQAAMWMVMEKRHEGEKPGTVGEGGKGNLHDHRFMEGMPGMGIMPGSTPELMYMTEANMGWMNMGECHHCSMPLPEGKEAWKASSVTAQGITMRVRCALCARDWSAETQGSSILHLATEDPSRPVVVIADDRGDYWTSATGAVFLEQEASHAGCSEWSQAFTSRAAFDAFIAANPERKGAKALTLKAWWEREGKKPDTYYKPEGPVENPYAGEANRKKTGAEEMP